MPSREQRSDGLKGQWLPVDELSALASFKGAKRAFKTKFNNNLGAKPGEKEPGIKAVVRREYQKGDVICEAGAFGSTAFLLLEGSAVATLPERSKPVGIPGRNKLSLMRLRRMFQRRSQSPIASEPHEPDIGEISRYASLSCTRPPQAVSLQAGEFFGVDTCMNFYPREATVTAQEHCVVLEMLRSVLDTLRDAGEAGGRIEESYQQNAVRSQLYAHQLFSDLGAEQIEQLVTVAELLTPDSDEIKDNVIYTEADAADAMYLVRAGSIKLSQQKAGGEFIFGYMGRGSAIGLEAILPARQGTAMVLTCTSHAEVAAVEVKGAITLGRSAGCDIVLNDRAVGRRHCRLEERQGDVYLADLDSANGTKLNDQPAREAVVAAGDRITVAEVYTFQLTRGGSAAEAAASAPARLATATGLDNFEVIKIKTQDLMRVMQSQARSAEAVTTAARTLEAAAYQRSPAEQTIVSDLIELNLYNSQNTLLIDLDRCTRCDECVRACSDAHGGVARFTRDGPRFGKYLVTLACRSCTDPKCMSGCPVSSIRRRESLEVHIEDWCIGCEKCANQCPFGNINMVELTAPSAAPAAAAPAVSLRATVCDLCAGLDGPSCVYACPHDAAIRVNPGAYLSPADLR